MLDRGFQKQLRHLLGLLLVVVALIYFIDLAIHHAASLSRLEWSLSNCATIIIAIVLYSINMVNLSYGWYLMLGAVGESTRLGATIVIYCLSQFAKYIPGNVAHHISRVALASSYGLKPPRVIFTMMVEAGWGVLVASTLSVISLIVAGPGLFENAPQIPSIWQLAFAAVAAAIIPMAGLWLMKRWRPAPLGKLIEEKDLVAPKARSLIGLAILYALCYFLMGVIADILARRLFGASETHLWLLTGAFSVAWIAGFLTPGAPAGLGVRDVILVSILAPIYGDGVAMGITVSLRAVTTLGDGLTFVGALVAKRHLLNALEVPSAQKPKTMENQNY